MKYVLFFALMLSACSFGAAPAPEEKKSFSCDNEKAVCIFTKETCITSDKKKKCNTSVDITCNSRGDEGGELVWQSKTMVVGNTTTVLNCQVSSLLK